MSTPFTLPFGETVTVVRRAGTNRHGDPIGDDADHDIAQCGVDWNATVSNQQFQDVQVTDVDLYVPRAADIVASDKVEIGSRTFSLLGKPMWDQVHPMTGTDYGYKLVRLREVSGA
ncbi:hypothetical protein [Gordonia sp. (in: high G+C Gram-positive bacteria)]|uniref:hypothetical protein n=1 Tax=Gordonia sp. (in: high G+C Gram-positive bacteria) TaxID=84139 RepID=UPI0039E36252